MGAEVLIPLAIAAAGTGAQAYNADRTAKKQDQVAAQGLRQQAMRQREANTRVDSELTQLAGSDPTEERRASNDQFMQQLQQTRAAAGGSTPAVLGASERYGQQVQAGAATSSNTAARIADLMSRSSAPLLQRQGEGQGFARTATDVGMIGRAAAGDDFLNQLRLKAVRPNPWVNLAAGMATNYAGYRAGQAGAGVPASTTAGAGTVRVLPAGGAPANPYGWGWQ